MDSAGIVTFGPDQAEPSVLARSRLIPPTSADRRERVRQALDQVARAERADAHPGDNRHRQRALLVIADVPADRVAPLQAVLHDLAHPAGDLEIDGPIPFLRLETVHFARALLHPRPEGLLVEGGSNQPPLPAQLVFATDFDGPLGRHLDELVTVAGDGLGRLFQHCAGWTRAEDLRAFLLAHRRRSHTEFVGTPGRSVHQIRREDALRTHIQELLDQALGERQSPPSALDLCQRLREAIGKDPRFGWAVRPVAGLPRPPLWVRLLRDRSARLPSSIFGALAAGLVVLPVLLTALCFALLAGRSGWWGFWAGFATVGSLLAVGGWLAYCYLGHLSDNDRVIIQRDPVHARALAADEDQVHQNQMSSVIFLKQPLWFRRAVLRGVLHLFSMSSRWLYVEGKLGKIESIHFARWAIVDGGRRLLFFSNFDGSWEAYLGEFVDKAHGGLTSIWSNCVGFPRTSYLSGGGAADEEAFKAYSRDRQVPTALWYSAYKSLTVDNINQNSRIRLGLSRGLRTEQEGREWLALL